MNVQVHLPLDNDGFLRRECPSCKREFKWHPGPANEDAENHPAPGTYRCPFCGEPADADQWYTAEQVTYLQQAAAPATLRMMADELSKAFGSSARIEGGEADRPLPLTEPDDMTILTSPCHAYEPIKVPDEAAGPFHCLICGSPFAV